MKKIIIIFALTVCSFSLFSQNRTSDKSVLPSIKYSVDKSLVDKITLNPLSQSFIDEIISENQKDGSIYKVSESLPLDLTTMNSGTSTELKDGGKLWRITIKSEGAKATALRFKWFDLPKDAEMYVYCDNSDVVFGPYTREDNISGKEYLIGIIPDDEIHIEYLERETSAKSSDGPAFNIEAFDYFFRGVESFNYLLNSKANSEYGSSGSCNVNINCPEGTNWQSQKKGVCKIYIGNGICSGTLINNTLNDGTPYVLFADHCGGSSSSSVFNQCQYIFNLESSGCTNSNVSSPTTFTGSTRVARGDENSGSDFLLVRLTNATTTQIANANLVYNGWNRGTAASPSGVSIHHPAGDNKKISTYTSAATTSTFTNLTGSAWLVRWVETETNWGITEGGSSGSPLFNNNGLVVGTLSGGASGCYVATSNKYDLYGKFCIHWDNSSNGTTDNYKLKPWLDPDNSGATTCPFFDPNNVNSSANFTANPTTVNVGGTVQFTDASTISGTLTSRSWSFPGGTPSTSTAQNPTVVYNTAGTYNVSLTINTSTGNDTETKTGYIIVSNSTTTTTFTYDFEACTNFVVDNFSPCTTSDGDLSSTYGAQDFDFTNESYTGSFIAFNPSQISTIASNESWQAHGGNKYGACFAATTPPNNDWFILPKITVSNSGTTLKFWAKSLTEQYGKERFTVNVSTTTNAVSSFSKISSGTYTEAPTTWTEYSYNLSNYAGQQIYLAIHCVSDDAFVFQIDDISVVSNMISENFYIQDNFNIYPNPSNGNFSISAELLSDITISDINGKIIKQFINTEEITSLDLNLEAGIYFVTVKDKEAKTTKKLIVN